MATPVCYNVFFFCFMSFYLVTNKHNPVHVREQFSGSIASYAPRNGRASPRFARERFSSTSAPDRRDWLGSGPGGWPPTEQQYVRDERGKRRVLAARSGRPSRTWERGKCAGGGPRCAGAARRAVRPEGSEAVLCVSAVRVQGELSLFPFWRLVFSKDVRYRRCTQKKKKQYTIVLLPPQVPGFTSTAAPEEPLLTERITVTMASPPGITPVSQIPPGYEVPNEGNYNTVTGFLENGNQRFLHHER